MKNKVLKTIQKYTLIENGDILVLGVSGGPYYITMLDILNEIKNDDKINLNFEIIVCHINHMIREEANEDEEYVKKYCNKKNIQFYSESIDVKKLANNNKTGVEETGRTVRYEFFNEICKKTNANKIAIAHNKNDKIETIIMNVIRGTGISGLKGIEAKRGKYIRPLIECERFEIENYCEQNKLNPRIDKTNFDNEYTRNKIRNVVIPYIKKEFNPNIIETIDRLSDVVNKEDLYIEEQMKKEYKNILQEERNGQIVLNLKKFNNQEKVIKARLVLYTITRLLGNCKGIEKIHIEDIIKLCSNNIGNKYLTPNKNVKVLVKNHQIYFISQI